VDENQTILLIDDSDDDRSLMRHACRAARFKASLQTVNNGEEAIAYLEGEGIYADRGKYPVPNVLLLDLKMPKKDGFEVLRFAGTRPEYKYLWMIVLTASDHPKDVERAFDLGAHAYLAKPSGLPALISLICCLRDWLDYNLLPSSPGGTSSTNGTNLTNTSDPTKIDSESDCAPASPS
jgi:CheY-like chemotaxis protein